MKLTGTNSSIGLIVLIDHAHQRAKGAMMMLFFCPDAVAALPLRSGRAAKRLATALRPVWEIPAGEGQEKTCSQKDKRGIRLCQLLNCFALSRPGGHGGAAAPVPIPNTAVKRPSANGTSSQDAGE